MKKKMLVVVDYQNDFVDGALGFDGAEKLDDGIAALVDEYMANGDIIIVTMDTHDKKYLETREGKQLPIEHCIVNTDGHKLYGKTGEKLLAHYSDNNCYDNMVVLHKETFGVHPGAMCAFVGKYDVDEIEIVGLVTNMCVMANACCFQAAYPNAQITVRADLVDSFDKELHQKTLDVLRGMQVRVI